MTKDCAVLGCKKKSVHVHEGGLPLCAEHNEIYINEANPNDEFKFLPFKLKPEW